MKEHLVSLSKQISVPFYGGQMYTLSYTLDPPSIAISTGDTQAVTGELEDSDGSFRAYCVGITLSDPNVGTIVGPSSCPMTFTAVGSGAAQVQGRSNGLIIDPQGDRGYLNSNTVPIQVTSPIPTSLSVVSATSVGCPGSMNYGERIDVQYQVLDQYMKPLKMAGMVPYEKGTFFTGGNFDQQLGAPTASDGTFHDNPVGVCSRFPIPGLPLTATQAIRIGADGNPVRSQTLTLSAPAGAAGFGHGTIVNSLMDINVSR